MNNNYITVLSQDMVPRSSSGRPPPRNVEGRFFFENCPTDEQMNEVYELRRSVARRGRDVSVTAYSDFPGRPVAMRLMGVSR